ncbi:MAG TPA: hypothetical protein VII61_22525, partial [Ktedonobacteraceae bacterium]
QPMTYVVPHDRMEHIFAAPSLDTPISGHTPASNQNTPQVGGAQIHPIRTDVHVDNNNPARSSDTHPERTQQRHHPLLDEHYPDQAIGPLSEGRQVFATNSHPNVVYDDGFAHPQQYPIALEEGDFAQANGPIIHSLADSVSEERFPEIAILQGKGGAYVHAGGSPYVKAQNLARALHWGAHLFAHDGFVVLQGEAASSAGTFFVIPLKEPVQFAEESTFSLASGEQVIGISASLLHTTDYTIIIVVDDRGRSFFGNREQDPWTYQQVAQTLAQLNLHEPALNTPMLSEVMDAQAEQTRLAPTDHGILSIIGWMDRTLFAALPWKKRYAYLTLLIAAWRSEQEKTILLHIICSTPTGAELAAIFALLRKQGKYAKLFEHFDVQLYEMLQVLGDFTPDYGLDWHYLATVVTHAVQSFQAPHAAQETPQELLNTASGLLEWLLSRRVNFLFSASEEVAVSPEQLSLLLWLIQKAHSGDRPVQMFLTEVVAQTDSPIKKAIRGFSSVRPIVDEHHYQGHGRTPGDAPTLEKLHAAFILKFLHSFLRSSEVHAALDATEDLVERLEILTKTLTSEQVTNNVLGNLTEQMSKGLDTLLEYPQWDRAAIIDLLIGLPATSRHGFLYTMLFVAPSQLEMWELQTLQELAVHPRAQALIREAGYELFAGVFQHVRHSWIRLDLFVERLAVKRRAIGDPLAYQEFLDRLGNDDAAAFDEIDHPSDLLRFNRPE